MGGSSRARILWFVPKMTLACEGPFEESLFYGTHSTMTNPIDVMAGLVCQSEEPAGPVSASTTDSTLNSRLKILWKGLR